ncbi:Lrp/AsnC family transcriptional regulator [Micrococcus lylae]|uniref:Lrp/AsnC family transcriptional regulator n=1 Tax=Micrococcus lylae TaxID=1273 RepID=UPI0021557285|nr:Lrp/AsnC family transcriptional regulator [Micrococcus lylae]WIK83423.1 Lrp/AsnC family transcriptional regulator [Micrococcus lylae]
MGGQGAFLVDDVDRRVLMALREDPRGTVASLADTAGVSRPTFRQRLDRMWASGIITGQEPQLDLAAIGFTVQAWVDLEVVQGSIDELERHLRDNPAVVEAFSTTGEADVRCRIAARDTSHLQELLVGLAALPVIRKTRSSVILRPLVLQQKVRTLDMLDL